MEQDGPLAAQKGGGDEQRARTCECDGARAAATAAIIAIAQRTRTYECARPLAKPDADEGEGAAQHGHAWLEPRADTAGPRSARVAAAAENEEGEAALVGHARDPEQGDAEDIR